MGRTAPGRQLPVKRVLHGVTPIHVLDAEQPGYRDVLVVTFATEAPAE